MIWDLPQAVKGIGFVGLLPVSIGLNRNRIASHGIFSSKQEFVASLSRCSILSRTISRYPLLM